MDLPLPLVVAAALAAGIWFVWLAFRLPTLHACLVTLGVSHCLGVEFGSFDIGPITLSADRLAVVALVTLCVVKRLVTEQPAIHPDRVDLVLLAFLALLFWSVLSHSWSPRIRNDTPPWYRLVSSFAAPALMYWIARFREQSADPTRQVAAFFVGFGVYLAVTAVGEIHQISGIVFPRHILNPRELYWGRASGPLLSSPAMGTWITLAATSGILLWRRAGTHGRILILLAMPLLAYAQYLTKTRSSWIGFAVALPMALVASKARIPRPTLAAGALASVLLAAVFVTDVTPERVEGRGAVAMSTSVRLSLAQRSLTLFLDRPLLGWGFGQFEHASETNGGGGPVELVPSADALGVASHNELLRVFAETGLIGGSLFVVLFGFWIRRARRGLTDLPDDSPGHEMCLLFLTALVAYWAEALFHDVTHMMIGNLTLFFLAGCLPLSTPAQTIRSGVHSGDREDGPALALVPPWSPPLPA